MKVAFYQKNGDTELYDVILDETPETVLTYDGSKNFQAVLLNFGDEAFIKVLLDE